MKNNGVYIEITSIEEDKKLNCEQICNIYEDCVYISFMKLGTSNANSIKLSQVYMIICNVTDEKIRLREDDFTIIDNEGFSHKCLDFNCETYSNHMNCHTGYCDLYPNAKERYFILSNAKTISEIIYDDGRDYSEKHCYFAIKVPDKESCKPKALIDIRQNDFQLSNRIESMKLCIKEKNDIIKDLKKEIDELEIENGNLIKRLEEKDIKKRSDKNLLCKYEIIEDDDYYRLFSLEEYDTVSFFREFDKSKGNYNWINQGEAFISLRADNSFSYGLDGRTIIKSPVSGIFEFDKNKMIEYKEEICRIKKYPQESKNQIIEELERKEIKENVYKKERKKMIEREALDELIEEGKVFNVYTKKDGSRTTIPMDIANAVWNRDGGKCVMCGSKENLEFDHIIPISKGGATTFRNLQILCKNCNTKKSDRIG